jgi:hypothetical protein
MKNNHERIDSNDPTWAKKVAARFTDVIVKHCRARVSADLDDEERKLMAACPSCNRRFRRRRAL